MPRIKVHVLCALTHWGDKLFFADSIHSWVGIELKTTRSTFPWWCADIILQEEFYCKCYIQRGNERIWESFEGDRYVVTKDEELAIQFNERNWFCVVCEDVLTNPPVLCTRYHPFHRECFEPAYISTLNSPKTISLLLVWTANRQFKPKYLSSSIPRGLRVMREGKRDFFDGLHTWENGISPLLRLRYDKVKKILEGSCVECPNAKCTFVIPKPEPNTTYPVLKCPECNVEWCRFCEKQLAEGEVLCSICNEGLRSVFQDILDAIEEAAGTMCPQCKYRGQKYLEECTHITCDCGAQFCYCCGVGKDDVDTADPFSSDINRLYGHNENWETFKDTRCPMWLSDYSLVYRNWPDDPYKSQKKFHEIKAQQKLIEVKSKTPDVYWNRVLELDRGLNMQVEKFMQKTHTVL